MHNDSRVMISSHKNIKSHICHSLVPLPNKKYEEKNWHSGRNVFSSGSQNENSNSLFLVEGKLYQIRYDVRIQAR